ncbi:MAG: phosphopyruvate hydratase [Planctomycetes bacterium]|nr:phosphopyruvate hydratase [Planctomycetota bacterium]
MSNNDNITSVHGRRVWDSRGRPTVECEIELADGSIGRAIAPAGASTGSGEALDLRDQGQGIKAYDVQTAIGHVNTEIQQALLGKSAHEQEQRDQELIELDGTPQKSRLGGNALIATSMALAHAAAASQQMPLWQYLRKQTQLPCDDITLPLPEIQIFGGGAHAEGHLDLQDFMVVPYGASSFSEAMEWVAEVYYAAGSIMSQRGTRYGVADEGGYWPVFSHNEEALETLVKSIELAGFSVDNQIGISLDIAANQIMDDGKYYLKAEKRHLDTDQWYELMSSWLQKYPIVAIEDPFHEEDFHSHSRLLEFIHTLDRPVQLIGDDLLVTNLKNIQQAKDHQSCNALLCKPNQAGTLSEAKAAFHASQDHDWGCIVSARSGESEDVTIVHLALGWGITQLKVGSFARSERMAKWNEVIRIEDRLGDRAHYAGGSPIGRTCNQAIQH